MELNFENKNEAARDGAASFSKIFRARINDLH